MVLFATIQLVVPISLLGSPGTYRFGWQMFSTYSPQIEFTVHFPDRNEVVDLNQVTARLRADLDLEALIPPFVCEQNDDAVRVTWLDEVFEC